jgi:hypothetical protein
MLVIKYYMQYKLLNIYIYTIDKCLEVVLKFGLELYSDHTLKNLITFSTNSSLPKF